MKILIATVVVLALAFIWRRYFYSPRPEMPPLMIEPDDPLMENAMAKAKATVSEFMAKSAEPESYAKVKVPFVSSSGTTEYLWAELISLAEPEMTVRYLTPPVTHTGRLERVHTVPISDLVDWQVEFKSGRYAGGFTMQAMFIRGREQWGSLPPELEVEERKYEQFRSA